MYAARHPHPTQSPQSAQNPVNPENHCAQLDRFLRDLQGFRDYSRDSLLNWRGLTPTSRENRISTQLKTV